MFYGQSREKARVQCNSSIDKLDAQSQEKDK